MHLPLAAIWVPEPDPSGSGPVARRGGRNLFGTPDRVLMCAPASLLATPAPPLSIPGPGLHNGFLPGPIVVNGPDSPAMGLPSRRGAGFKGPSESGTGLGPGRPWLPECWPGSLSGPVAARSRSGVAFWVAYPGGLGGRVSVRSGVPRVHARVAQRAPGQGVRQTEARVRPRVAAQPRLAPRPPLP